MGSGPLLPLLVEMYVCNCIVLGFLAAASAFARRPPAQGRFPLEQCRRADALVAEVKAMWAAGNVDHREARRIADG